MRWLALESSCDETALAVWDSEQRRVLYEGVLSQVDVHASYGGVVPGIAVREHLKGFPILLEEFQKNFDLSTVDALCVTHGPGLIGCLGMGVAYAQSLQLLLKCPLYGVNHLHGHALSPFIEAFEEDKNFTFEAVCPHLGLLVSGGNTLLFEMNVTHGDAVPDGERLEKNVPKCENSDENSYFLSENTAKTSDNPFPNRDGFNNNSTFGRAGQGFSEASMNAQGAFPYGALNSNNGTLEVPDEKISSWEAFNHKERMQSSTSAFGAGTRPLDASSETLSEEFPETEAVDKDLPCDSLNNGGCFPSSETLSSSAGASNSNKDFSETPDKNLSRAGALNGCGRMQSSTSAFGAGMRPFEASFETLSETFSETEAVDVLSRNNPYKGGNFSSFGAVSPSINADFPKNHARPGTLMLTFRIWAQTVDDAAGEALDKGGKLLGFPYPGGPLVERCAQGGDENFVQFPRAFSQTSELKFSFSGLKTSLRYFLEKLSPETLETQKASICASYQAAVTDALICKVRQVLRTKNFRSLGVSGGVSNNQRLRQQLQQMADREKIPLFMPKRKYCGDNAAMIAFAAPWVASAVRLDPNRTLDERKA